MNKDLIGGAAKAWFEPAKAAIESLDARDRNDLSQLLRKVLLAQDKLHQAEADFAP
jgi:hypothetical protein